jgi:bifunctional UDP-N-acetylglucosamine pyrophosphorylase/glucosamine-1-phosphate N-acetyltransferase
MSRSTGPVAIVLAAGKGTRMKSARSKVLFPVLGRPIVARVVDAARAAGCADVVVVVAADGEAVRAAVPGCLFAVQPGQRGTGEAVAAARPAVDWTGRTVLILPGDVPLMRKDTLVGLLEDHEAQGAAVTIATMTLPDATGYGRVVRDGAGAVARIVEHRDATEDQRAIREVNTSIYAMDGSFLFGAGGGAISALGTDNDQGEYYLTDVVGIAVAAGRRVSAWPVGAAIETAGVNDRVQLAEIERALRLELAERFMRAGVSMDDPGSVRIEERVQIGRDVELGADVELRGDTVLDEGVSVGRGAVLTDCRVEAGARLGPYVVATRARIGPAAVVQPFSVLHGIDEKHPERTGEADAVTLGARAEVGPFSHLRQASAVRARGKVGNFVELKKTELGEGAKANHLAYLGDATIGARSNVGAGVITCNYDGVQKHETTVEEDVFVGTDSHLVAPVRVGKGAYIATGTTVTHDVPADALAIGRARQENKLGYASRIRSMLEAKARGRGGG